MITWTEEVGPQRNIRVLQPERECQCWAGAYHRHVEVGGTMAFGVILSGLKLKRDVWMVT